MGGYPRSGWWQWIVGRMMGDRPHWHEAWCLFQQGKNVREIAFALDLADVTVEKQIRQARRYYEVREKTVWEQEIEERLSVYDDDACRLWLKERLRRWGER